MTPELETVDVETVDVGTGRAVVRMRVGPVLLNTHGTCHGGFVFLLADTAFELACNAGQPTMVAASATVDLLAPVREGAVLTATGEELVEARPQRRQRPGWRGGPSRGQPKPTVGCVVRDRCSASMRAVSFGPSGVVRPVTSIALQGDGSGRHARWGCREPDVCLSLT